MITELFERIFCQRWSRGHRARGQGQRHKKIRSQDQGQPFRGQILLRPRTGILKANGQGPGTLAQVFSIKNFFQTISKKKKLGLQKILLVLELRCRGFHVQSYSDDLAVLVSGVDMLWIRGMAQKAIYIGANWASEQKLQFSSKKTEIVSFTHQWNPDLSFLSMNDSKLELFKEARLLGVTMDSKLTWKLRITRITR